MTVSFLAAGATIRCYRSFLICVSFSCIKNARHGNWYPFVHAGPPCPTTVPAFLNKLTFLQQLPLLISKIYSF